MSLNRGASNVTSFFGALINHIEADYHLDDHGESIHIPVIKERKPPVAYGYTDISPDTANNLGGADLKYRWQVNDSQAVDSCVWIARLSALTAGGAGATPSYIDGIGPMLIDTATMRFNTKIIEQIYGEEYFFSSQRNLDPYTYADRASLERRDVLLATRRTDATAIQEVACHLDFWFSHHAANSWQQYLHSANADSVYFDIKTRDSSLVLEQTTNNKPTVTAPSSDYLVETFLRFRVWALPTRMREMIRGRFLGEGSHEYFTYHTQTYDTTIGAADTSNEFDLRQIDGHVAYSIAVIRPTANLTSDYTNNDRSQTTAWTSRKFEANGLTLFPEHTYRDVEYYENAHFYPGSTGRNTIMLTHGSEPHVPYVAHGGMDYHKLNNPKETVYFTAPGAAQTVHYWAKVRQIIQLLPKDTSSAASWQLKAKYFF